MKNLELKLKSNQIAFENFRSFIRARNYKGITSYTTPVLEFLIWTEAHGISRIINISQTDMNNYFGYITTRSNKRFNGTLSESTIKGHLISLNLLFQMLLDSGVINKTFVLPSFNRSENQHRNILTIEEIKELKSNCKNPLELSIVNIAYGCALRRTELECLNAQDVLLSKGSLVVRSGKNSKRREVPLTDTIIKELKDYIINCRPQLLKQTMQLEKAFFINAKGQRMSGEMLNDTLKYIIDKSGNKEIINKNITLHCLRASIATHLQEAGANVEFIRDFLGHTEIDTTMLYIIRRKKRLVIA
ncbi:MAG: tyrosine-type recombinase/integrase [Bacteroidales bacterium]|nr:tyrosine-type recombinase/integrase [Bacteroidales bacterium]